MVGNIGLLVGLALLIILALRGVNVFVASLLSSLVVAVTNNLSVTTAFLEYYPSGKLGAFTFAGKFFILFLTGAIFGRVMAESHAATSIAYALARKLGADRTLWIAMLACAFLTYGGVVVFIVIFTVYPLGLGLMQQANIPKRLFNAAACLGAGTFTMTALPGSPSIHNVIAATSLHTSLFAGWWIGLIAAAIMIALGMWYCERERIKAKERGEGFVPAMTDVLPEKDASPERYPHWFRSSIPLMVVMFIIIVPRLLLFAVHRPPEGTAPGTFTAILLYAEAHPLLWPSLALVIGSVVGLILFRDLWVKPFATLSRGAENAIMPLMNTAAVIGFGGVVTHTAGFQSFAQAVLHADLPPLISAFLGVNIVSGIVGSASGGLQIFMQTLAPHYIEQGVDPTVLHRICTLGSGGLDSLPHCGAVIATFTIMGITHREAYKDVFVITVLIPLIATLAVLGIVMAVG